MLRNFVLFLSLVYQVAGENNYTLCHECVPGGVFDVTSLDCINELVNEDENNCNISTKENFTTTMCNKDENAPCDWTTAKNNPANPASLGSACKLQIGRYLLYACLKIDVDSMIGDICNGLDSCPEPDPFGLCETNVKMVCGQTNQTNIFSFCNVENGCNKENFNENNFTHCWKSVDNWKDLTLCADKVLKSSSHNHEKFTPKDYKPIDIVKFLHTLPRISGGNGTIDLVSNNESFDLDALIQKYAIDYGAMAAPLIVLGVIAFLSLLIILITQFCGGCGSCCCCPNKDAPASRGCCTITLVFGASVVLALIGGAVSFWGVSTLNSAITTAKDDINLLGETMGNASSVITGIDNSITDIVGNIQNISNSCDDILAKDLNSTAQDLSVAQTMLTEAQKSLGSIVNMTNTTAKYISTYGDNAYLGALVVLLFCLFCMLFAVMIVVVVRCANIGKTTRGVCLRIFIVLALVLLIIILVSLILAGTLLMLDVFVADLCIDPSQLFNQVSVALGIDTPGSTSGVGSYFQYYSTCEGENKLLNSTYEAEDKLTEAAKQLRMAKAGGNFFCTNSSDNGQEEFKYLEGNIMKLRDKMKVQLEPLLECGTINKFYTAFLHDAFCTHVPTSFAYLWAGLAVGGFFMWIATITFSGSLKTDGDKPEDKGVKSTGNGKYVQESLDLDSL